MIYNKNITFTDDKGTHQSFVLSVNENKIVTGTRFLDGGKLLRILAKELSPVASNISFNRRCPFKFLKKNRDVFIQFAEIKEDDTYIIKDKRLFRVSNSKNIHLDDCFLFDIIDFLTFEMKYLQKRGNKYYLNTETYETVNYEKDNVVDKHFLIKNGFMMV